ncbi:MAG: hypothetical protein ACRDO4_10315 [Nocardioides sp.]
MTRFSRARKAVCLPLLGLALLAPALPSSPATSAASQQASLSISPRVFVGGQRITLSGNIGLSGVRTVRLEGSMGRAYDSWTRKARTKTDAQGDFSFSVIAPSMFGVKRRVSTSGGARTPVVELVAKSQDLVLAPDPAPVAGERFNIRVDTTPTDLRRRPDLPPPVFPNRRLTLQKRDGTRWVSLQQTTIDDSRDGEASFSVTVNDSGVIDYRVRQEKYTANGNEIGWFPSFPTRVRVSPGGTGKVSRVYGDPWKASLDANGADSAGTDDSSLGIFARAAGGGTPAVPASNVFGWRPAVFDFAFEHGESLDSPPARGTKRVGRWVDAARGYGRAAQHNGGVMLDSKRDSAVGPGDRGSTWVTLRDNPRAYGRWEVRVRVKSIESRARDYRTKIELVPDRRSQYRCGGQNITVGSIAAHSRTMRFGVKSAKADRQWSRSRRIGAIEGRSQTLAVEVSKRHITWFRNGRVVGTVRNRAAVSDVPLTLRLTLDGKGDREMNRTMAIFDWMRGFSLKNGKQKLGGNRLKVSRYRGGC